MCGAALKTFFKWCIRLRLLWNLVKSEKGILYNLKNALFDIYVWSYVPWFQILMANFEWKKHFYCQNFCITNMVWCSARDPRDTGSRPACILIVFNRQWTAHIKLFLLRNMLYKLNFPFCRSLNLGKVGHIFTHFRMLYAISALLLKLTGHWELHWQPQPIRT